MYSAPCPPLLLSPPTLSARPSGRHRQPCARPPCWIQPLFSQSPPLSEPRPEWRQRLASRLAPRCVRHPGCPRMHSALPAPSSVRRASRPSQPYELPVRPHPRHSVRPRLPPLRRAAQPISRHRTHSAPPPSLPPPLCAHCPRCFDQAAGPLHLLLDSFERRTCSRRTTMRSESTSFEFAFAYLPRQRPGATGRQIKSR